MHICCSMCICLKSLGSLTLPHFIQPQSVYTTQRKIKYVKIHMDNWRETTECKSESETKCIKRHGYNNLIFTSTKKVLSKKVVITVTGFVLLTFFDQLPHVNFNV